MNAGFQICTHLKIFKTLYYWQGINLQPVDRKNCCMKYPYLHIIDLSTIQACKLTPKAGVKVQLHHTLADWICENKVRGKIGLVIQSTSQKLNKSVNSKLKAHPKFLNTTILSGIQMQIFAHAMSVKMRLKSTWSTATPNITSAKNPARRWTSKQFLCQSPRSQSPDWPSCLAKQCQCRERCLPSPPSTWWRSLEATSASPSGSPSSTSSFPSRWFGSRLCFARLGAEECENDEDENN